MGASGWLSMWGGTVLGLGLGLACILWGVIDWAAHRHDPDYGAGGQVLFTRIWFGALAIMAGIYRWPA